MTKSYETPLTNEDLAHVTPWQPSKRAKIAEKIFLDNDAATYLDAIRERNKNNYIITGIGVQAVRLSLFSGGALIQEHGKAYFSGRPQREIQREFEQEKLGLEPESSNDGLRYWESSAGFASGLFPIESLASFADTDVPTFERILNDKELTRFGAVIIRNANTLVPVMKNHANPSEYVYASGAMELSDHGEALLDVALEISDYSTH